MASGQPSSDDVEEAKVEVEYDEPTDEREINDVSQDAKASNPAETTSRIDVPQEGASLAENALVDDDKKDGSGDVKQIQMTVAADAPWKDRLWEGSF
jgi:hypothetical protein